jgi:hypothetical protein
MYLFTGAAFDKFNTYRIVVTITVAVTPVSDTTTDAGPCSACIPA